VEHLKDACLRVAELRQAEGDAAGCEAALAEADAMAASVEAMARHTASDANTARAGHLRSEVALTTAYLRLLQGDLEFVGRWLEQAPPERVPSYFDLHASALLAWHRILRGQAGQAVPVLQNLASDAHQKGWLGSEVEALALLSCAHRASGDTAAALKLLGRTLILAEPEGFARAFVNKGEVMAELLGKVKPEGDRMKDYVGHLLSACGRSAALAPSASQRPILTERELQILRLLAADRSYPEIAGALFLSVNTVKTHVKRLYDKLGVDSRLAAVETARAMQVIG
jgi:LuxR family maltose regulon positive regulatory protein